MFIAARAILNVPVAAWSRAKTLTVIPLNDKAQHVPQLGELNPGMTPAPPMLGNVGTSLNLWKPKRVIRPFGPSEHETVVIDPVGASYIWSKETETETALVRVVKSRQSNAVNGEVFMTSDVFALGWRGN